MRTVATGSNTTAGIRSTRRHRQERASLVQPLASASVPCAAPEAQHWNPLGTQAAVSARQGCVASPESYTISASPTGEAQTVTDSHMEDTQAGSVHFARYRSLHSHYEVSLYDEDVNTGSHTCSTTSHRQRNAAATHMYSERSTATSAAAPLRPRLSTDAQQTRIILDTAAPWAGAHSSHRDSSASVHAKLHWGRTDIEQGAHRVSESHATKSQLGVSALDSSEESRSMRSSECVLMHVADLYLSVFVFRLCSNERPLKIGALAVGYQGHRARGAD